MTVDLCINSMTQQDAQCHRPKNRRLLGRLKRMTAACGPQEPYKNRLDMARLANLLTFIRSGCLSAAAPCVSGRRHELKSP
jgi:hypothetical protein